MLNLSSLIGLSREKSKARVAILATAHQGGVFPHTLLYGIGGTGKTRFARAIGYELNCHFVETHAAAFKHRDQLFDALVHYSEEAQRHGKPLVFFIDEVHRLKLALQEALYSAMKEWWIPTDRGKQYVAPFTLMAATTRFDKLDANSFVTRFPNTWELDRYPQRDIEAIVAFEFDKKGVGYAGAVIADIAKRCLGIPRIAITLSDKVLMTVLSTGARVATLAHTQRTFDLEEIDPLGLDPSHHRYLRILDASKSSGRHIPMGIGAISAKMRSHEDMISGSIEPILLEFDFVAPTPKGRILTETGAKYLAKFSEGA